MNKLLKIFKNYLLSREFLEDIELTAKFFISEKKTIFMI